MNNSLSAIDARDARVATVLSRCGVTLVFPGLGTPADKEMVTANRRIPRDDA